MKNTKKIYTPKCSFCGKFLKIKNIERAEKAYRERFPGDKSELEHLTIVCEKCYKEKGFILGIEAK